jgi:hypothetical protein
MAEIKYKAFTLDEDMNEVVITRAKPNVPVQVGAAFVVTSEDDVHEYTIASCKLIAETGTYEILLVG